MTVIPMKKLMRLNTVDSLMRMTVKEILALTKKKRKMVTVITFLMEKMLHTKMMKEVTKMSMQMKRTMTQTGMRLLLKRD